MSDAAQPSIASLKHLLHTLSQENPEGHFANIPTLLGDQAEAVGEGQINLARWDSCLVELVFVQVYDSTQLSHVDLQFDPGCTPTLTTLESAFGAYRQPPMRGPGQATAMFTYDPADGGPSYTLIARVSAPLQASSLVARLSIRPEY
ncbi:MAG: hypothetical protein D6722_19320 [Bacteroidetes bacterium]|nr:MAG: hypothetical protein D6722_19320 [Bacteroidota bacterium]